MRLLKALPNSSAFTVIETLVVLGIATVVASFGLFLSMDFFRGQSINNERDLIVNIFQKTRSHALSNQNQLSHGVRFEGGNYLVFEGVFDPSDPSNETIPSNPSIDITWPHNVVFQPLSGDATETEITISDGAKSFSISINNEGGIIY